MQWQKLCAMRLFKKSVGLRQARVWVSPWGYDATHPSGLCAFLVGHKAALTYVCVWPTGMATSALYLKGESLYPCYGHTPRPTPCSMALSLRARSKSKGLCARMCERVCVCVCLCECVYIYLCVLYVCNTQCVCVCVCVCECVCTSWFLKEHDLNCYNRYLWKPNFHTSSTHFTDRAPFQDWCDNEFSLPAQAVQTLCFLHPPGLHTLFHWQLTGCKVS